MKLVVPYTKLERETYQACRRWPDVEFVDVSGSDTAYAELLCELWARAETVCLCEHDVVPAVGMLGRLAACHHPYCAHPVALSVYLAPCLSLTKFDRRLMLDHPDAMRRVMRIPSHYGPPGHWKQLDVNLQQTILLNRYKRQPHIHLPEAEHLNPTKRVLVPGAPLRTWVDGRFALPEPPDDPPAAPGSDG